jgi:hypothetical protein
MELPENNKLIKVEYTNTQQDWPVKIKKQLDMQGFLAGGFVLPKVSKSWSLLSSFSSSSSMLTILGKHLTKQSFTGPIPDKHLVRSIA